MVKINWEMTNVKIFPFTGTSNIIFFSCKWYIEV